MEQEKSSADRSGIPREMAAVVFKDLRSDIAAESPQRGSGQTKIIVFEGEVVATTTIATYTFRAGETGIIGAGGEIYPNSPNFRFPGRITVSPVGDADLSSPTETKIQRRLWGRAPVEPIRPTGPTPENPPPIVDPRVEKTGTLQIKIRPGGTEPVSPTPIVTPVQPR